MHFERACTAVMKEALRFLSPSEVASPWYGLSTGHALRKVYKAFESQVHCRVCRSPKVYVDVPPLSYQSGLELVYNNDIWPHRGEFAGENHGRSLPHAEKYPELWRLVGQGCRGCAQIYIFNNYHVSRHFPLFRRTSFDARLLKMSRVKKRLKDLVGLELKRQGMRRPEFWMTEGVRTFTLYNSSGDMQRGTLSSMLEQADLLMNVHDFLRE